MFKQIRQLAREEQGTAITEYALLTALVAIAAYGVVKLFGEEIRVFFAKDIAVLSGEDAGDIDHTDGADGEIDDGSWQ